MNNKSKAHKKHEDHGHEDAEKHLTQHDPDLGLAKDHQDLPNGGYQGMADGYDRNKIAETAYFLAESRGFTPGQELDDWVKAENIIESVGWQR